MPHVCVFPHLEMPLQAPGLFSSSTVRLHLLSMESAVSFASSARVIRVSPCFFTCISITSAVEPDSLRLSSSITSWLEAFLYSRIWLQDHTASDGLHRRSKTVPQTYLPGARQSLPPAEAAHSRSLPAPSLPYPAALRGRGSRWFL